MSTLAATPHDPNAPGFLARNHFLLRRLQSLTGIFFGLYLILHLTVNATLVSGPGGAQDSFYKAQATQVTGSFQGSVNKIHELPFLLAIEIFFIYLPIAYHSLYGAYIIFTGQPNVGAYGYTRNWLYVFQRVTAVLIFFFILFHVLGMKGLFGGEIGQALTFDPHAAYETTIVHIQAAWWVGWVIYPIGVLASAFHTANGFYTGAITWGLTISAKSQLRWAAVCGLLFMILFGGGVTALAAGLSTAKPTREHVEKEAAKDRAASTLPAAE